MGLQFVITVVMITSIQYRVAEEMKELVRDIANGKEQEYVIQYIRRSHAERKLVL